MSQALMQLLITCALDQSLSQAELRRLGSHMPKLTQRGWEAL